MLFVFKKILMLFLLLGFLWAFGFGVFAVATMMLSPQKTAIKTDAIVVLTGGNNRIYEGLSLYAERLAPELFISGVFKDVTQEEIRAMWDGDATLPECCLTLGYAATTTEQNGEETKGWARDNDIKSIRLVTGNYHMLRSLLEMKSALPDTLVIIHPVEQPDLPRNQRRFWELLFSEYHKTLYRGMQLLMMDMGKSDET